MGSLSVDSRGAGKAAAYGSRSSSYLAAADPRFNDGWLLAVSRIRYFFPKNKLQRKDHQFGRPMPAAGQWYLRLAAFATQHHRHGTTYSRDRVAVSAAVEKTTATGADVEAAKLTATSITSVLLSKSETTTITTTTAMYTNTIDFETRGHNYAYIVRPSLNLVLDIYRLNIGLDSNISEMWNLQKWHIKNASLQRLTLNIKVKHNCLTLILCHIVSKVSRHRYVHISLSFFEFPEFDYVEIDTKIKYVNV